MGNSPEFLTFHRKLQCYDDTLHFCPFSAHKIVAFLHSFHRAEQQSLQYATQTYLILLHIEAAKLLTTENKERLIDQSLIDLHAAINNIAISFDSDS